MKEGKTKTVKFKDTHSDLLKELLKEYIIWEMTYLTMYRESKNLNWLS